MSRRNAIPRNKREAEARERALGVLAAMRRDHLSITAAAKEYGTVPRTVRKYVGSALRKKRPRGHYYATARDRLARTFYISTLHAAPFTVRDSRTASRIGKYMNARGAYARNNPEPLKVFEGKSFRTTSGVIKFVTDTSTLDELANADELRIDKLYLDTMGPQR